MHLLNQNEKTHTYVYNNSMHYQKNLIIKINTDIFNMILNFHSNYEHFCLFIFYGFTVILKCIGSFKTKMAVSPVEFKKF